MANHLRASQSARAKVLFTCVVYTKTLYYIDTDVLLKNIPLVKFIKKYIRDPSGLFSIIPHVSLLMISLISNLSLKLYLNLLVYHRNIFGSSSKVFGNLRKSLGIFGNFRKFSENVRERSSFLRNNFEISSEIFGRWSEIFGKSSETEFYFLVAKKQYFTHLLRSFVNIVLPLENKIHIFAPRVISSMYLLLK